MIVEPNYLYRGQWRKLNAIARLAGMSPKTIKKRLALGMTISVAAVPQRTTVFIEFEGKTLSINAWANELGMPVGTLRDRLQLHRWPIERALTEPPNHETERLTTRRNRRLISRMSTAVLRDRNQQVIHRISTGFRTGEAFSK